MSLKDKLQWRYATKQFDTSYQIATDDLSYIKSCIQLAASSYGLQPYNVLHIQNPALRASLKSASWNQSQITDASELFVFCNFSTVTGEQIDQMVYAKGELLDTDSEKSAAYAKTMKSKIGQMSKAEQASWAAKQVYIALGNGLMAAAELGLDACPIEGFEKPAYNEILGLESKGLESCVVLTIGKRSEKDKTADKPKYRKDISDLFEVLD